MNRSAIRLIVLIGTISIIGIIVIQIYWIQKTFSIKEKQFNQSVTIALGNVAKILYDYNNDLYEETCGILGDNPVEQLSADYYVVNVNCGIDADILEHYLKKELEEKNIKIDFEYGIYDCSSDEMVYGNYITYNESDEEILHGDGLMVSYVHVDESYEGASDGAIDLIISGGEPPYIYMWSDGVTTEDITNITAGIHIVTITDNENCIVVDTVKVGIEENISDSMLNYAQLHKYDKFTYYFGVYFPTRPNFIAGNMRIWYLFSAIMLVIIIFFAYSLIIILKQRKLTEVQNDFINNMTHEFKTPLSSISISADVLNDDKIIEEPDRLKKYAVIIKEQNTRLQGHVEKVLKMASISKNKIRLNRKDIILEDIILKVISEFEQSIENNSGKIVFENIGESKKVNVDILHFSNVIINILDNAYKYSVKDPEIQISTENFKNKVILKITDNGIGIKKEHLKRIFQKFYRVPTGDIHNVKGFGLGLNYVYNIIKAHNYSIKVESEINIGTCFIIIIPNLKKV